jgi:hypothetical protein
MLSRYHQQLEAEKAVARASWDPRAILFDEQWLCFTDQAQLRLYDCTRRSGKSRLAAVELIDQALRKARAKCLFLALTREDARDLVWEWLLEYNEDFALGAKVDLVRLTMRFPNGSRIKLGGAKDLGQAGRWRGRGYDLIIIDECQTFPAHLRDLVESVLMPTMLKEGGHGRLVMMGTPGEVPGVGYWEEQVEKAALFGEPEWADKVNAGAWSKHKWSLYQNPHLGTPEEVELFLDRMAGTMGGRHASRFQREYLGQRPPPDSIDRPYQYDPAKCDPTSCGFTMPLAADSYVKREANRWEIYNRWELPLGGNWTFVLGIDLGSRAASAMSVLGSTDAAPGKVWLVEEWLATRRLPSGIRDRIIDRRGAYNPKVMAVDEGALGDMIAEEWRQPPYSLPVTAAEKLDERVHCDFVSAAMQRGEFMVPKESRLAQDMAVLRWDTKKLENGKRKVALEPHSDIEPASRYAFKDAHALAMAARAPKVKPTVDQVEAKQLADERRAVERNRKRERHGLVVMGGRKALDAWKR